MAKASQPLRGEPVQGATVLDRITERDLAALFQLHSDANAALMAGEARTFSEMLRPADDFTLKSPFGGAPSPAAQAPGAGSAADAAVAEIARPSAEANAAFAP